MSDLAEVDAKEHIAKISVLVRTEDDGKVTTWKARMPDGRLSSLRVVNGSDGVPRVGVTITIEEIGQVVVAEVGSDLQILTGDLVMREAFDPRRVYETPNSTSVVFKRVDQKTGKIVLWSYKANAEIMVNDKMVLQWTDRQAKPTAAREKKLTQKSLAAWLIANEPNITGKELTLALRRAFPEAAIGDRHGPHYLSLSRKGKLPEAPDEDPRTGE
jgi:hypothetical protein